MGPLKRLVFARGVRSSSKSPGFEAQVFLRVPSPCPFFATVRITDLTLGRPPVRAIGVGSGGSWGFLPRVGFRGWLADPSNELGHRRRS